MGKGTSIKQAKQDGAWKMQETPKKAARKLEQVLGEIARKVLLLGGKLLSFLLCDKHFISKKFVKFNFCKKARKRMEAKKFSFEENFVAQCVFPCFIMYCAKKISSRTNFCPSYVIVCYINPLFISMDLQITAIHLHFKKSW